MDTVTRRAFIKKCMHTAGAFTVAGVLEKVIEKDPQEKINSRDIIIDIFCTQLELQSDMIQTAYHGKVIEPVSEGTKERWRREMTESFDKILKGA